MAPPSTATANKGTKKKKKKKRDRSSSLERTSKAAVEEPPVDQNEEQVDHQEEDKAAAAATSPMKHSDDSKNLSSQVTNEDEEEGKRYDPAEAKQAVEDSKPSLSSQAAQSAKKTTLGDKATTTVRAAGPPSFATLRPSLSKGVLQYIEKQGFTSMTPVQAATIPLCRARKDVAVQAVTGSGKTLAFGIPLVEHLLTRKYQPAEIGALILAPTRELAQQTYRVVSDLCEVCDLEEPLLLVGGGSSGGGLSMRPVTADLQAFQDRQSTILVGTPGRVEDILTKYAVIQCAELDWLILDEADVLLNMGFATSIQNILSKLPKHRRTGLFSATTASSTDSSLKEWMHKVGMRNPVWVDVAVTSKDSAAALQQEQQQLATPSTLRNYYLVAPLDEKLSRLATFLQDHKDEKVIVFFLTCACVDFFGSALQQILWKTNHIELLHGKMVQKRREKTMERFRRENSNEGEDDEEEGEEEQEVYDEMDTMAKSKKGVKSKKKKKKGSASGTGCALFCTDVAARGLDVSHVKWVVQFDAPQDPAFYIHRVGRSARAGRSGSSLVMLTRKEEAYVDLLQLRKVPLEPLPSTEACTPLPEEEDDDEELPQGGKDKKKKKSRSDRRLSCAADPTRTLEDVLPKVRDLALRDRDILEKGTRAFTSYVRAYKEHHCAFIFRFASLDLGLLATSFSLLRLPKMPEFRTFLQKKGGLSNFTPAGREVDLMAIPFLDKAREEARQIRLRDELAAGKSRKAAKAEAKQLSKAAHLAARRADAIRKGRNPDKKRGRNAQIMDEWDALAKEEKLYKKFKKGKITEEEMEAELLKV